MSKFYSGKPDYFEAIALDKVPNKIGVSKFGHVTVSTSEVVVWDGSTNYNFLSDDQYINIVSTSADDVNGGSGAWIVKLFGLDIEHNPITEDVVLNGLTPVQTIKKFHRLNRMYVIQDGNGQPTNGTNTGEISATAETLGYLQARIEPHEGQTLMCVYTTPKGYEGLLWGEANSGGRSREVTFRLKWRNDSSENNGSFSTKSIRDLYESAFQKRKMIPVPIGEMTDIVITAIATQSVTVSASFDICLVKIDN